MLSWLVLIGPLIGGRDNVCHLVDQPTKQSLKAFLYGVAFQIALGALMRNMWSFKFIPRASSLAPLTSLKIK